MEIYISNSGTKPIYEQITDQIKAAILAGKLAEGEAQIGRASCRERV